MILSTAFLTEIVEAVPGAKHPCSATSSCRTTRSTRRSERAVAPVSARQLVFAGSKANRSSSVRLPKGCSSACLSYRRFVLFLAACVDVGDRRTRGPSRARESRWALTLLVDSQIVHVIATASFSIVTISTRSACLFHGGLLPARYTSIFASSCVPFLIYSTFFPLTAATRPGFSAVHSHSAQNTRNAALTLSAPE